MKHLLSQIGIGCFLMILGGCSSNSLDIYRDANMDFGAVRTVAVLPFANLTRDNTASDRVRDVFTTMLMATGGVYALPPGEVARGISRAGIANPVAPSVEEAVKVGGILKVDALITGVVREYGEVRSATSTANVISLSMQMVETQTGRIIWTTTATSGGIGVSDRLFGGGGRPMNEITEKAVNEIISKLF
ncbi:MAG TPA: GNA1162 family protein [Geobacteraceae bacterium]|nr:GNA1162 family protein [Geobacteraceae bacterium]